MKKIVETIVEGAIGLAALYIVGHIAYQVGKEVTEVENRYQEMTQKLAEGEPNEAVEQENVYSKAISTQKKKHPILGKFLGNKIPVIGEFISNPEGHKFEAFVDGDHIRIDVKKKAAP